MTNSCQASDLDVDDMGGFAGKRGQSISVTTNTRADRVQHQVAGRLHSNRRNRTTTGGKGGVERGKPLQQTIPSVPERGHYKASGNLGLRQQGKRPWRATWGQVSIPIQNQLRRNDQQVRDQYAEDPNQNGGNGKPPWRGTFGTDVSQFM